MLIFFENVIVAQNNQPTNAKEKLHAYYELCQNYQDSAQSLKMWDTCFTMAKELNDIKTQCSVKNYITKYHLKNSNEDTAIKYAKEAQEFAKKNNQLRFYYNIMGLYAQKYINERKYNSAMVELTQMIKESLDDKYYIGTHEAYYRLAQLNLNLEKYDLAISNFKKALEYVDTYDKDFGNKSDYIIELSRTFFFKKDTLKALNTIDECKFLIHKDKKADAKILYYKLYFLLEYNKFNWFDQEYKENFDSLVPNYRGHIMCLNCIRHKEDQKAKEIFKTMKHIDYGLRKLFIETFGTDKEILQFYKEYWQEKDSIQSIMSTISLEEFSNVVKVKTIESEKQDLEINIQKKNLLLSILLLIFTLTTIVILIHYIKKNKLINKELTVEKARAEKSEKFKSNLLMNFSHEIRTPMNSIYGFSELIFNKAQNDDRLKKYCSLIQTNTLNLLEIINKVIFISDPEPQEFKIQEINIYKTIKILIEKIKKIYPQATEIELLNFNEEYTIQTNNKYFGLIISNLIDNQLKFSPNNKCTIYFDQENKRIEFTNFGINIPMEYREKIFDSFYQIDNFAQGLGLGLYIAKLCAKKLNMYVWLDLKTKENATKFILQL